MNKNTLNFSSLTVETEDSFSSLLELAAEDNAESFKIYVERDPSAIDEIGLWYGRKKILEPRTPLMVAATYGSVRVLNLILSASVCDVNRRVGDEKTTALHCAASGGSSTAVVAVKILIAAGADVNLTDANGRRPADVIVMSPKMTELRMMLEQLLDGRSSTATSSFSNSSSSPTLSSTLDQDEENEDSFSDSKDEVEKREYPIDPTLPDIKNSVYSSDEFRMFSFKIRPCSRAYSHDWTECPFVHPGENARRRDPRKYHYSCVPCPDFRKGACRRGDLCEYAHGVFECWLHPAQYRTRLCKDGTGCARRVCFFAHTPEELRPLYLSTGSAVPSPRSMDMLNPFTPPMSPSGQGSSLGWPQQQSVPTLHLPQSSRLRASLSARDMHVDHDVDYSMLSEFDAQARLASLAANRSFHVRPKAISPSNLDELFSAEIPCSPRYSGYDEGAVFSPSHKSAVLGGHNQMLHASLGMPSPSRMSPRNSMEQLSPLSSRVSALAQHEKLQQLRSLSSRELGASVGSPVSSSWSNWGSPTGKLDWGVNGEELGSFRQSLVAKPELGLGNEEPDVSWVQTLVSPPRTNGKLPVNAGGSSSGGDDDENNPNGQVEEHAVLGAWLEQMQLDQLVA